MRHLLVAGFVLICILSVFAEDPPSNDHKTSSPSGVEILSDTRGVDFGPYLDGVMKKVRENWYNQIPEVARAPLMKKGNVSIESAIMKDGRVQAMRLICPSGDAALDDAALGGITASSPFAPLPTEFDRDVLTLRFHFQYNPEHPERGSISSYASTFAPQPNVEILSDTRGVDFSPYLVCVVHDVTANWYMLMPTVVGPPQMKQGDVIYEFAIMKDGSVKESKLDKSSGDISMDRAAWGGIIAANPFQRLPTEFDGEKLTLRFHFQYNPTSQKTSSDANPSTPLR